MIKKKIILVLLIISCFCMAGVNAFAQQYNDVSSDYWAHDAISQVSAKKWFGGYPDGSFMPENQITRAEALTVFAKFLGLEIIDIKQSSFYDIDVNEWYAPYIEAGKDLFPSHTTIQGKTPFNPELPTTREDTVYALVKALGCMSSIKYVDQSVLSSLNDYDSISASIRPYFAVALMEGLVSGYPDNTVCAQKALTRAEFATLLLRGTQHGFHDNYQAKIQSVVLYPSDTIEIEIGEMATLTARAAYTDGRNLDYNDIQPYDSENSDVISLSDNKIVGLKEGTTTIKFNSEYLRNESVKVVVTKPGDGPKFKIFDYKEVTDEAAAEIGGMLTDEDISGIEVKCSGKDVLINGDGTFSVQVALSPGINNLTFVAVDQYGVSTVKTITIVKPSAPVIKINDYDKNTTQKSITVTGYITDIDPASVNLTCNGNSVRVEKDGAFFAEVNCLVYGKNNVKFSAVNKYGKKSEENIEITCYEFYNGDK